MSLTEASDLLCYVVYFGGYLRIYRTTDVKRQCYLRFLLMSVKLKRDAVIHMHSTMINCLTFTSSFMYTT